MLQGRILMKIKGQSLKLCINSWL